MSDRDIALSGEATLNVNKECLKSTNDWSGTTYYNICNGKELFVAAGSADISLGVLGVLVLVAIATVIGAFALKLVILLYEGDSWT